MFPKVSFNVQNVWVATPDVELAPLFVPVSLPMVWAVDLGRAAAPNGRADAPIGQIAIPIFRAETQIDWAPSGKTPMSCIALFLQTSKK